jgi:hypothetical protein
VAVQRSTDGLLIVPGADVGGRGGHARGEGNPSAAGTDPTDDVPAATGEDDLLLVAVMRRVWMIAAMQGHRGIDRRNLADLSGAPSYRAALAISGLEAGGCLVAVDAETVRAAKPFRR